MRYGYALLRASDENGVEQTSILLKADCEKIYLERETREPRLSHLSRTHRQPRLIRLLSLLRTGDVLVVNSLSRLSHSTEKLSRVIATLHILDVGFIALADAISTMEGPRNQVFEVFTAFERVHHDAKHRHQAHSLDEIRISAAKKMLASGTVSISDVALQLGVAQGELIQSLGPNEFIAQLMIAALSKR